MALSHPVSVTPPGHRRIRTAAPGDGDPRAPFPGTVGDMSVLAQAMTDIGSPLAWQIVSVLALLGALVVLLRWWFANRKR